MITEGKMQYLYDDKGRRYLDVSTLPFELQLRCILHIWRTATLLSVKQCTACALLDVWAA